MGLTLSNPTQRDRAVFITALVAHDSAEKPAIEVQCETMPGMWVLSVKSAQGALRLGVVLHSTERHGAAGECAPVRGEAQQPLDYVERERATRSVAAGNRSITSSASRDT